MLALQDVEYLITAEVHLTDIGKRRGHPLNTYRAEIERRAKMGKCYHRPYLGVREFAADFDWEINPQAALERRSAELGKNWQHIWPEEDLGLMLYDVFAPEARAHGFRWLPEGDNLADPHAHPERRKKSKTGPSAPRFEGALIKPEALFFFADVRGAKLDCHPNRARFAQNRVTEI